MSARTILDGYIEALQILASQTGADRPEFERMADEKVRRLHIDNYRAEVLNEAMGSLASLANLAPRSERAAGLNFAIGALMALRDHPAADGQAPATEHYDKTPDPADGCHWCSCGNRWPCPQDPAPQPETAPDGEALPEGRPLTVGEAVAALNAGYQMPRAPWADDTDLEGGVS